MSRRTAAWLISGAVSAAAVFAQAGQPPPSQPPRANGLLAGRVVDAAGNVVPGAVVVLRADTVGSAPSQTVPVGRAVPVRTDGEGRFVFTDVPAGKYQVDATKPGWLPGALGRRRPGGNGLGVELGETEHRNDLKITVWRAAVIAGMVTDDNGDPLVGVEVRAVQLLHIAGRRQMVVPQRGIARQKTDDRGAYRFSDLVPGDYLVAVLTSVLSEPPGFAGAIRAGGATPNTYYQTMTATGTAPIVFDRATGVTAGGRGLVGSLSGVSGVPTTENTWLAYPTTYHPSSVTQSAATVVRATSGEPRTSVDVHVRMVPTWQVSGVLTGPDGPAAWHGVHLVPADTGDSPLVDVGTSVTDADGAFTFYGVPPGQYIARVIRIPLPGPPWRMGLAGGTGAIPYVATFGGGPSSGPPTTSNEPLMHVSVDVTVTDRHVRDLALTMSAGPRVRGRAVFEGTSPAPTSEQWRMANVSAAAAGGREDSAVFPSAFAADGQFTSASLWPGKYLLRVTPPRGWFLLRATYQGRDISAVPIEIASDIENVVITFTDRARTVKGTVQADADSKADATVVIFPVEPEAWVDHGRSSRRVMSGRVTETGTFSFAAPADGEYYVMAIPEADTDDWQNPVTLAKIAAAAERVRIQGDGPPSLLLRMRRIQ